MITARQISSSNKLTAPDCFHRSTHQERRQWTKAAQRKMLPAARPAQPPTTQLVALNASESPASGPWMSERRPINENHKADTCRNSLNRSGMLGRSIFV